MANTTQDNVISLYAAHLAKIKHAPGGARSKTAYFAGPTLYDDVRYSRGKVIAHYVEKRRKRFVLLSAAGRRNGSWGRASKSLGEMLERKLPSNIPIYKTGTDAWFAGGKYDMSAGALAEIAKHDLTLAVMLAQLYRIPASQWLPKEEPKQGYRRSWPDDQSRIDRLQNLAWGHTSEGRKELQEKAKRASIEAEIRRRRERPVELAYTAFLAARNALVDHEKANQFLSGVDIAAYFGVTDPNAKFKVLHDDGRAAYGEPWLTPTDDNPGPWQPVKPVRLCRSGYHLSTMDGITQWLGGSYGDVLWLAEGAHPHNPSHVAALLPFDMPSSGGRKTCYASARLLRRLGKVDQEEIQRWLVDQRATEEWKVERDRLATVARQAAVDVGLAIDGMASDARCESARYVEGDIAKAT